jgi:RNA polymerase sigma factor (sigma-70 family)
MTSPSIVLLRTQSDERLVALVRAGHERAFDAIVERYRRPLLRACRRVLSETRAEDALQQALMAAWRGLERGDEVRELRSWLYRIAHNTALNQLRISGYDFDELQESLRPGDAADEELERRAVVRQTLAGLAALPERQRDALLAIAVEGRSQDEVALELGLSEGAVRQLVHRARTTLRAAATAITPLPLVTWAAAAATRAEPVAQRIAELGAGAGGAGAAAAIAKAGAVVVLAGGAIGGPALVGSHHGASRRAAASAAAQAHRPLTAASAQTVDASLTPGSSASTVPAVAIGAPGRRRSGGRAVGRSRSVTERRSGSGSGSGGSQRSGGDDGGSHSGSPTGGTRSGGDDERSGSTTTGTSGRGGDDGTRSGDGSRTSGGSGTSGTSGSSGSGSGSGSGGTESSDGSGSSGSSGGGPGPSGGDDPTTVIPSGDAIPDPTATPEPDSSGSGSGSGGTSGSGSGSGSGSDDPLDGSGH